MARWYSQNCEKVTRAFHLHRISSYLPASLSIISSLVASISLSLQRIEECTSELVFSCADSLIFKQKFSSSHTEFYRTTLLGAKVMQGIQKYSGNPARWHQACAPSGHHQVVLTRQDQGKQKSSDQRWWLLSWLHALRKFYTPQVLGMTLTSQL